MENSFNAEFTYTESTMNLALYRGQMNIKDNMTRSLPLDVYNLTEE